MRKCLVQNLPPLFITPRDACCLACLESYFLPREKNKARCPSAYSITQKGKIRNLIMSLIFLRKRIRSRVKYKIESLIKLLVLT